MIGGRAGTDLQGQIRESHPGASEVTALYAMSTENSSVGSESVWPVVVTTVSKKVVPPRVYQTKVHVGVTARNVLEAIAQHHVPGYVEPVEVIGVAAEVEHVPVPASTRRQPCSPFPDQKKAIVAVEHSILTAAWHMLTDDVDYHDLGGDYFARLDPERAMRRIVRQANALGYTVRFDPIHAA